MNTIKIEWTSDNYECDDCGTSWADGADVYLNGEKILELVPIASCFGGNHWSENDVYKLIIEKLGYTVTES